MLLAGEVWSASLSSMVVNFLGLSFEGERFLGEGTFFGPTADEVLDEVAKATVAELEEFIKDGFGLETFAGLGGFFLENLIFSDTADEVLDEGAEETVAELEELTKDGLVVTFAGLDCRFRGDLVFSDTDTGMALNFSGVGAGSVTGVVFRAEVVVFWPRGTFRTLPSILGGHVCTESFFFSPRLERRSTALSPVLAPDNFLVFFGDGTGEDCVALLFFIGNV